MCQRNRGTVSRNTTGGALDWIYLHESAILHEAAQNINVKYIERHTLGDMERTIFRKKNMILQVLLFILLATLSDNVTTIKQICHKIIKSGW